MAENIPVIVITASKKPQSLSTVGTSVTVLDENFFKETNEYFFLDALASNTTSSNFFQSGGHGTASAIQLRGLPKRYSTVYIDGVKMSEFHRVYPMTLILIIFLQVRFLELRF